MCVVRLLIKISTVAVTAAQFCVWTRYSMSWHWTGIVSNLVHTHSLASSTELVQQQTVQSSLSSFSKYLASMTTQQQSWKLDGSFSFCYFQVYSWQVNIDTQSAEQGLPQLKTGENNLVSVFALARQQDLLWKQARNAYVWPCTCKPAACSSFSHPHPSFITSRIHVTCVIVWPSG